LEAAVRLGVFADSHVSVARFEPASWHNPYRLHDSAARLERALAHPLLATVDAVVGLGDLCHYGDAASLAAVVETVAARHVPAVLVSGNHDVLEDGVRLEEVVDKVGDELIATPLGNTPTAVAVAFEPLGASVLTHEITAMWPTPARPFAVVARSLVGREAGTANVLFTHFPVLSLRRPARAADLLYAGHLADLADPLELPPGPTVVLSGHLHLRGVTTEGGVLQVVFAALVEDPFDVAVVELTDGGRSVSYECVAIETSTAERIPVLAPATGSWHYEGGRWLAG
jgi:predicted phosphodiesterase